MYLVIKIRSPESRNSTIIRIRGENRETIITTPLLINIFNNDKGFGNALAIMNQDRNFLMNRVGFEEKITLGSQILLNELEINGFEIQRDSNSVHEWAKGCAQDLDAT